MKRIFAIIAAVVLCFALTVPAFAVDYNGTELGGFEYLWTDKDKYRSAVIFDLGDGFYRLYLCDSVRNGSDGDIEVHAPYIIYDYDSNFDSSWEYFRGPVEDGLTSADNSSFVWSSSPINDSNDDLEFEDPPSYVLENAIPNESLTGALSEVMSMLAVALPVVAGLFGIRKGIAFLIGRIRGV